MLCNRMHQRFIDFLSQLIQQLFKNSLEIFGVLMAGVHFCLEHTGVISLRNGDCFTLFTVRIKHQLKVLQKEFFVDVDRVMNVGDAQSDNFEVLLDSESHFTANIWKLF